MSAWESGAILTDEPSARRPSRWFAALLTESALMTRAAATTTDEPSSGAWKRLKPWKFPSFGDTGVTWTSAAAVYLFGWVYVIAAVETTPITTTRVINSECCRNAFRYWTGARAADGCESARSRMSMGLAIVSGTPRSQNSPTLRIPRATLPRVGREQALRRAD